MARNPEIIGGGIISGELADGENVGILVVSSLDVPVKVQFFYGACDPMAISVPWIRPNGTTFTQTTAAPADGSDWSMVGKFTFDASNNTNLTSFTLPNGGHISKVVIPANWANLYKVDITGCGATEFVVNGANHPNLSGLFLSGNALKSLDLGGLAAVHSIIAQNNQLTALDLSPIADTTLIGSIDLYNNCLSTDAIDAVVSVVGQSARPNCTLDVSGPNMAAASADAIAVMNHLQSVHGWTCHWN